ncbi:GAF domain-containing protein [Tumebacillus sp. BK434]|uniref:HD-GYP domain-containing protein n=1 Tax=Tumebacillus sp. BK434 TaxID=2512169 RepID=UPI0010528AE0|nr:HD domain-containing phosphohydrolase [Tumebacillus sp. BK434]TCP58971.1 GAF domain-containing protein [Tumebacillus sp. BK434]
MGDPLLAVREEVNPETMLKIIFDYIAKITAEKRLGHILMLMADMGREMILADRCTLWLLDEERQELRTTVAHDVSELRIPVDSGVAGHTIRTGQAVIIDDAYQDDRFHAVVDQKTGYRTRSILVIPIRDNEGRLMGAFQAINKMTAAGKFTQKDLEHLTLAAYYSGKSLESAMLAHEIEETQKEIIFTMGEVGETRSKETGNHVKRVAEYSKILALRFGLSEEEAELIKTASPMHDIGKVAIPDAILNKPGKLTTDEYELMKTHTTIGYQLLNNSKRRILKAAATIAIEHHEKWNGTGYPHGLQGEEIHLYGRITAVADVFDALASDRPYKKAWELDRILDLFREERGRHFDPQLVDVFFESLDEILEIRSKYGDNFDIC